jgi:GntR family transcriptional repressor for pyruvate dehydrogenase complex
MSTKGADRPASVLAPVEVKKVTSAILEQLEDRILGGDLVEGQKLPSEQELAEQAGVGRRAIREALKALEMKGLITIRKGSGAFVVRNDFESYMDTLLRNVHAYLKLDRAKLGHILQFRELLAGSIIRLLASNPRPEVMEKIQASISLQEQALAAKNAGQYNRAHLDYHLAIVNSVENPVVTMMYSQVIKLLQPYMKISGSNLGIMRSSIAEHKKILRAIKAGDVQAAQAAFHEHLQGSRAHLEELVSKA